MSSYPHHVPRLYVSGSLSTGAIIPLSDAQSHYLRHVLRLEEEALLRAYNEQNGEFLVRLRVLSKKQCVVHVDDLLRAAPPVPRRVGLAFSPLKKDRMDFLIEKSVELGCTDFFPLVMRRSVVRDIKRERMENQIIEAAEQCERLDIPVLHALCPISRFVLQKDTAFTFIAALERQNVPLLSDMDSRTWSFPVFLIGPEGGFDPEEIDLLHGLSNLLPVSLGQRILRAETSALYCLSHSF